MVEGRSGFRYGESEILKLLRVPRGSVRGKMRRAKRRRRSVALQRSRGALQEGWQNHFLGRGGILKKFRGRWAGGQSTVVEGRFGFRYGERGGSFQETAPTERRPLQMALGTSALVGAVIAEAGCLSVVLL